MPAAVSSARRKTLTNSPAPARRRGGARDHAATKSAGDVRAGDASRPTSLKLPAALKAKIDDLAAKDGLSPHAFMLNTLAAATEQAYLRRQFQHDAQAALSEMKATGLGHELGDVNRYFERLAAFRAGKGPRPRRPAMTRTA